MNNENILDNLDCAVVIESLRKATNLAAALLEKLNKENQEKAEVIAFAKKDSDEATDEVFRPEVESGLMNAKAVAKYIGVSESTVRELGKRGVIPEIQFCGAVRYHIDDVNDYI